tara:strand:+ start:240 stop:638 length:399 start_codon:yes stop_codon:yes gene_type:complete
MNQYKLSDYLSAINYNKVNLLDGNDITWHKKYPPYVINRCLSQHVDTIMMANEVNQRHGLDKRLQFHFLLNSIRKRKRFGGKWITTSKSKNLEFIKKYYGYSNSKAKVALDILTKKQIEFIKLKLDKGGRKK